VPESSRDAAASQSDQLEGKAREVFIGRRVIAGLQTGQEIGKGILHGGHHRPCPRNRAVVASSLFLALSLFLPILGAVQIYSFRARQGPSEAGLSFFLTDMDQHSANVAFVIVAAEVGQARDFGPGRDIGGPPPLFFWNPWSPMPGYFRYLHQHGIIHRGRSLLLHQSGWPYGDRLP
jgi:hypothetical protein